MGSNFLINLISSRTCISMKDFKEIISSSNKNAADIDPYCYVNIFRQLQSLGFCDCNHDGDKIYSCHPEFVMLYTNLIPKVILVGARTPELISKIKNAVEKRKDRVTLNIRSQKDTENNTINLPELVEITAIYENDFREIAKECGIICTIKQPVIFSTLRFSVPIKYFNQNLIFKKTIEINWEKRVFLTNKLHFSQDKSHLEQKNRLIEYTNPVNNKKLYYLWKGDMATEVNAEWGRYLILHESKTNVLLYNKNKRLLYVPLTVPLPTILARAATMCSGKVALKHSNLSINRDYLVYQDVPEFLALKIAEKLGQQLDLYKGRAS